MTFVSRNLKYVAVLMVTLALGISAAQSFAQERINLDKSLIKDKSRGFCSNNNWSSDDRVSYADLREFTVPSSGSLNVDADRNGGISVKGENRSDVLVRACVQAWGATEDAAKFAASSIRIATGSSIKAENQGDDRNWSVSYQILVPRSTNLNLKAHNGGISIAGVDGTSEFETQNGGINLSDVSGSVKGRTTNGGVNVALSGTTWRGSGLELTTTNGGVNITMPESYAATVETGTVNGGFKSDIPSLNVTTEDIKGNEWSHRSRSKRITTALNGGGPPIKIITTNGGVKINSAEKSSY